MARLTIQELRQLVRAHTDWEETGLQPPEQLLDLDLGMVPKSDHVLDPELAHKTLSFEGREVTVVLDFDDSGYLIGIEFV